VRALSGPFSNTTLFTAETLRIAELHKGSQDRLRVLRRLITGIFLLLLFLFNII
jgi:hypothetical protein